MYIQTWHGDAIPLWYSVYVVLSRSSGLWSPIDTASSPNYHPANSFSAFGPNNSFNLTGGKLLCSQPEECGVTGVTLQFERSQLTMVCVCLFCSFHWNESPKVIGASAELAWVHPPILVHLGHTEQRLSAPLAQQLQLPDCPNFSKSAQIFPLLMITRPCSDPVSTCVCSERRQDALRMFNLPLLHTHTLFQRTTELVNPIFKILRLDAFGET